MSKITLDISHPNIAKQWHPTKNGDLKPSDVTYGSAKKIWWKCPKGDNHEWELIVLGRTTWGNKCPFCSGRRASSTNNLTISHPSLAKEWHSTKNGNLTPTMVLGGAGTKVWWKCDKGDDHEWETSCNSRTNLGSGCPVCKNLKIVKSNCLSTTHPHIAKQWHPSKNGNLKPTDVPHGSPKRVWWKCDKENSHEWKRQINKTIEGSFCPMCSGLKVVATNSFAFTNPNLSSEWHPTKNGKLTPDKITKSSTKEVWWKCSKGKDHEWKLPINRRVSWGKNCPFCSGKRATTDNNLQVTHPHIAKQWHPTKNGKKRPTNYRYGTSLSVWWKCPKGDDHEWEASIAIRATRNIGCSICGGRTIVKSNCIATIYPKLIKEWHPIKNGKLTPYNVGSGDTKIWWRCNKNKNHEWESITYNRGRKKQGCPFCTLTPQSREELTILFELKTIFKAMNPQGIKEKINGKLYSIDMFIPKLNLALEYDGNYWHKGKRKFDRKKSQILQKQGISTIRLRQRPLKKIFATDILIDKKYDGKKITNEILQNISTMFSLNKTTQNKIGVYRRRKKLQNEQGLNDYIDYILTEKSKRKRSNS